MNLNEIHFIREVLVTDHHGKAIPTMQASEANADCVRPVFKEVAFYNRDAVRVLYHELGGGRREGALVGSTVIIPNRSLWANLWRISPAEVQILGSPDSRVYTEQEVRSRKEKARERNRLMRD